MLNQSDSPYSSAIVVVSKKDNTYWFCVDFWSPKSKHGIWYWAYARCGCNICKIDGSYVFCSVRFVRGILASTILLVLWQFFRPFKSLQFTITPFGLVKATFFSSYACFLCILCFKIFQMLIDIILVFTDNKFFLSTCFWAFWSFTATLLRTTHCKSNEVFIGVSKEWMSGAYCDKIHPDPDKVLVIHQQTILRLKRSCDCFKDWQISSENSFPIPLI